LCIGGSLGGGNMFQSNQTLEALSSVDPFFSRYNWVFGILLASLVGAVIIGGIRRIAEVTSRVVPVMCMAYVISALYIIISNIDRVPNTIHLILNQALTGDAVYGGVLGIMIIGITRAAFSNEAGIGSAAIAHSAAKTEEAAREGIVSMIGPFIDTVVICSMTALVVLLTGAYNDPSLAGKGTAMTVSAFGSAIPGAQFVLAVVVCLFAYSTMISWEYYGERAWEYLFGIKYLIVFRLTFVAFVFLGAVTKLSNVINFSDLMILSMAFPNIIGGVLLSPQIKTCLTVYWQAYKSGQMKRYR